MQVEMRKLCDLKNYEKNARTHSEAQVREIAQSIKEFGFNDPIEIDSSDVIISGHARALAASLCGFLEVPCVRHVHMNKTAQRAYILAANRIALNAGWDAGSLCHEFTELSSDNFDITKTGFTPDEIENYTNPETLFEGDGDADGHATPGTDGIVKPGDLWLLGTHRLVCGDSTDPYIVDRALGGERPNLMVTDPPYGVEYDPSWRDVADLGVGERSRGKVKNDDRVDWSEVYSLFPGNVIYVWHAGKYAHKVAENISACGFDIVSQIIWAKQHFALSRGDYHWQHEPCWYAVRKGENHSWRGKRDQSTLWEISNNNAFGNSDPEETFGHGTQKPLECMQRPIENNSRPGEWIYDPFGGAGTTLVACERTGRKCATIEIDPVYCDMIIKRWQKFTGQKAVRDDEHTKNKTETTDSH